MCTGRKGSPGHCTQQSPDPQHCQASVSCWPLTLPSASPSCLWGGAGCGGLGEPFPLARTNIQEPGARQEEQQRWSEQCLGLSFWGRMWLWMCVDGSWEHRRGPSLARQGHGRLCGASSVVGEAHSELSTVWWSQQRALTSSAESRAVTKRLGKITATTPGWAQLG